MNPALMMLLRGPVAGGGGLSVSYIGNALQNTAATTYTFAAADIGTAAADRTVIVIAHWRDTGTTTTLNSVTLGGNAMTVDATANNDSFGNRSSTSIARLAVASGTTATIAVTLSQEALRCAIGVFTITGGAISVLDTLTATSAGSLTLTESADGVSIFGVMASSSTATYAWTNATEAYDEAIGVARIAAASKTGDTAATVAETGTGYPAIAGVSYE